jgi:hypothetical protein
MRENALATLRKRGTYQWQALVRRKSYPPQAKIYCDARHTPKKSSDAYDAQPA